MSSAITPQPTPSVLVIGAGPAGSLAAIVLARAGVQVTIVEQHRFPRGKVCGECLSGLGQEVLERVGLLDRVRQAGAAVHRSARLLASNGAQLTLDLPVPMLGISREWLDAMLLDAAVAAGATLLQPCRCERIQPAIKVRNLMSNQLIDLRADHVVLADGKAALLSRRPASTGDFGIKAHLTGIHGSRDAIELFGLHGCYAGLAPIENGLRNLAISVPTARLRKIGGNLDKLLNELKEENLALRHRLSGATRVGDWLSAPLPRFAVAGSWPANVVPAGNAAAALEPIGGQGIGLALHSGELAARAIIEAIERWRPVDAGALRREFHHHWQVRRLACRGTALLLSCPPTSKIAVAAGSHFAPVRELVLRMIEPLPRAVLATRAEKLPAGIDRPRRRRLGGGLRRRDPLLALPSTPHQIPQSHQ